MAVAEWTLTVVTALQAAESKSRKGTLFLSSQPLKVRTKDQRWDVSKLTHPSRRKTANAQATMALNRLRLRLATSDQSCDVSKLSTHAAQTVLLADFRRCHQTQPTLHPTDFDHRNATDPSVGCP